MYGLTDGQIPPVLYRTPSPSEPLPKKKGISKRNKGKKRERAKERKNERRDSR